MPRAVLSAESYKPQALLASNVVLFAYKESMAFVLKTA